MATAAIAAMIVFRIFSFLISPDTGSRSAVVGLG
jgi:hypothetical protein